MKKQPRIKLHILYLGIILGLLGMLVSTQFFESISDANQSTPEIKKGKPLPANLFTELAKTINPTVVNISTTSRAQQRRGRGRPRHPLFELFEQLQPRRPKRQQKQARALGTGFIIRKDGLIVTNTHVVKRADVINVQLSEDSEKLYEAEVIGSDKKTDISLIKIDVDKKLPTAEWGSSEDVQVGEWVAAFGNPYGHGHTVTKGIISAKGREIDEINLFPFLQTDASINPGNSGGPLVNAKGHVIGVNTAIDRRAQGIGFAIPADHVKSIITQLIKKGHVERGYIGIYMMNLDQGLSQSLDQEEGALVTRVVDGSPAEKAGLKPHDLVVKFNGEDINSVTDLSQAVAKTPIGKKVKVTVIRGNKKKTIKLKVGKRASQGTVAQNSKQKNKDQETPYELGFNIADYSPALAKKLGAPKLKRGRPLVTNVVPNSPARRRGLERGDVILDVNRKPVYNRKQVIKHLNGDSPNLLRVLKDGRAVILVIKP